MMTFTEALYGVLQSCGWQGNTIVFAGGLTMVFGLDRESNPLQKLFVQA